MFRPFGRLLAAAVAVASGTVQPLPVIAQPAPQQPAPAFSGRDFGGVDLPVSAQTLSLSFSGARAWSWREGTTSRLFFERDVRIAIGPYRFVADRAVIWMEPVSVTPSGAAAQNADQIAVYLENARDPSGPGEGGTGSGAWLSQSATRLLITGLIASDPDAPPAIAVDIPMRDARPSSLFVAEAEARLARHLVAVTSPGEEQLPGEQRPNGPTIVSPDGEPIRGRTPTIRAIDSATVAEADPLPEAVGEPPPGPGGRDLSIDTRPVSPLAVRKPAIAPKDGLIQLYSPDTKLVDLPADVSVPGSVPGRAIVMSGGMTVQYDTPGRRQSVQLTAARGVVFLNRPPEGGSLLALSQKDVSGVYLEGDVQATVRTTPSADAGGPQPDQYVLRGSKVYYDVQRNSAVVLDAVFWTYDQERGMPLYLRADVLRQKSLQQFTAEKATLANVGFAEPSFAIGASSVTVTRDTASSGRSLNTYEARDVVFTAAGVPLAFLPKVSGEFKPSPLRRLEFESAAGSNVVRTVWDMYTVLGLDAPAGNRWDLLLDAYLERGPGVGTDLKWTRTDIDGSLLAYYIYDSGQDRLSSGAERDAPQESRGLLLGENIWRLDEHWSLFAEGSYISDEAFIDSFFRREAQTRREFASSLYLRRIEDSEAITAEIRGTFNDFIANQYLLQSLGYQTQKLPEFQYYRIGEDLFDGLISYNGEARFTSTNLVFDSPTLASHGYDTGKRARAAFDLLPTDRLSRVLQEAGFDEDSVTRVDTRHDFEVPLSVGPINVVPFAVGRVTAYDTDFAQYNADEGVDRERFWGAGGVRAATSVTRVDESFTSDFLDLSGIRHIVTPSLTAWSAGTNVDQSKLPIYDESVESVAEGTTVRAGISNVWQTHRPGTSPGTRGTMRSVDWLRINNDYIWASGDVDVESPFGRFIEARPERSNLGEFIANDAVLQLTDAVALTGDFLYDVESNQAARITSGVIIDHGFGFSTFAEFRSLEQLSSRYFDFGARYELTRTYAMTVQTVYDLDQDEFQSIGGRISRRFPQWTVEVGFSVDTITDEFGIGVVFSPVGASGEDRRRVFTRQYDDIAPTPRERDAVRDRADYGPFTE